jgi:hypothetical protein
MTRLRHEARMKSCLPIKRRPSLQQDEPMALNKVRARQRSKGTQFREQSREAQLLLTAIKAGKR